MTTDTSALLRTDPDTRTLQRIDVRPGLTGVGDLDGQTTTALVLDVETTGLDLEEDVIVELAMRRFRYDDDGVIVEIGRTWSWREIRRYVAQGEIARRRAAP